MLACLRLLGVWLGLALLFPSPAHAYVDPGVGAIIWQALMAGAFGALFFWRNARAWVRSKLPAGWRKATEGEEEDELDDGT